MKTFIALSKRVRNEYKKRIPIIAAMSKLPQREDVGVYLKKYMEFKEQSKSQPE